MILTIANKLTSLLPQAKCNISNLKSPNQYFHYPHYKLSINGSSLGKAPFLSPFTSEGCSGLTAGIAACAALWRVFPWKIQGNLMVQGFRQQEGKKIKHIQSSFPLSFGNSRKIRNRSWILTCFASFEQEWSWWEGFSLKGESAPVPHSPPGSDKRYLTQSPPRSRIWSLKPTEWSPELD